MSDHQLVFKMSDGITDLEEAFPSPDLLSLNYFKRYRDGYSCCRQEVWPLGPRNYYNLLKALSEIFEYSDGDTRTFAKTLRSGTELVNSEPTFAEMMCIISTCGWRTRG